MGPGQLCHQRWHFLVAPVGLAELPHPEQVPAVELLNRRVRPGDAGRELHDHPVAPRSRFDLAADVFADLPVQPHQLVVDGRDCPRPGRVDQRNDYLEVALSRCDQFA